ncbi:MAG: DNA polymerase III subunit tau [Alphaproteobacteria bacterium MarineAlpha9_Bin4]|nr:DNA polymerase III, subunit gamma and tau [Pelagibacterales bacterium]PPR26713.1 MAG: DNA polymerase III subunit tau [Alphaproteobacteria bacterium MarineAlpha9_Bin4]|tara:strand:- start:2655 stop:3890 length:1236 start_codon:yes stop_codon:yes gene_type:complete
MKKIVLSRKYRPKKISDVIGQDFAVKTIKNAFETEKLAHAFLLTGIRGVGKTTIARIIAMGLNCTAYGKPVSDPCNKCNNCKEIIEDRFDEVLELDAASHTSVDDIREIISYIKYRPSKGNYKVFIIDEVHMLSNSAFNALLKTIEEPPEYVKFIFCTTELNKIPVTILSRCQKFELNRVAKDKIILNLKNIIDIEDLKVSFDALSNIAKFSEGSIRDSITILEQAVIASESQEVNIEDIDKIIGYSGNKILLDIYSAIVKGDSKSAIEYLTNSYELGSTPEVIINELLHLTYILLRYQSTKVSNDIYNEYNKEQIDVIIEKTSVSLLNQFWQTLLKGREEMKIAPLDIEALEIVIIRLAYSSKLPTIEQLVYSINSKKDDDLNINVDNNDIGNDIKKILNIFPGSKLINK